MTRMLEWIAVGAKTLEWLVVKAVGVNELLIYIAIAMTAYGAAQVWTPAGTIVPGVVMLWMYLPQRARFVEPAPRARKDD